MNSSVCSPPRCNLEEDYDPFLGVRRPSILVFHIFSCKQYHPLCLFKCISYIFTSDPPSLDARYTYIQVRYCIEKQPVRHVLYNDPLHTEAIVGPKGFRKGVCGA